MRTSLRILRKVTVNAPPVILQNLSVLPRFSSSSVADANWGELDSFPRRHNALQSSDIDEMLKVVGEPSMDKLMDEVIPADIRL
eukprot:gene18970-6316_t